MSDGRLRLFVALALPDPVRDELVHWRERLPGAWHARLRPVSPEALHVTMCFLGWQPESAVEIIGAACEVVGTEPPPLLALADALWLPPRRPRVLAVELSDADRGLARIQAALSAALATAGWYQPEKRPYLPHVTVARVARAASVGQKLTPPARLEFRGSDVVLYRSRLLRSGARYEALARVRLGAASD